MLLNHPIVVGLMREVISPDVGPGCYGYRFDSCGPFYREYDEGGLYSHCGGNRNGNFYSSIHLGPFAYSTQGQQIYAGLTRCTWELNPVIEQGGATSFMSGSHKSGFPVPESVRDIDGDLFESYACPAGSLLVFLETCLHSGTIWKNPDVPRDALSFCFNHYEAVRSRNNLPLEGIMALSPERRTLFRGVWRQGSGTGDSRWNNYFAEDNKSL